MSASELPPTLKVIEEEFTRQNADRPLPSTDRLWTGREEMTRSETRAQIKGEAENMVRRLLTPANARTFSLMTRMMMNTYLPEGSRYDLQSAEDAPYYDRAKALLKSSFKASGADTGRLSDKALYADSVRQLYNQFAKAAVRSEKGLPKGDQADVPEERRVQRFFTDTDGKPLILPKIEEPAALTTALKSAKLDKKTREANFGYSVNCLEKEYNLATGGYDYVIKAHRPPTFMQLFSSACSSALREQSGEAMYAHFLGAALGGMFAKAIGKGYRNALSTKEVQKFQAAGAICQAFSPHRADRKAPEAGGGQSRGGSAGMGGGGGGGGGGTPPPYDGPPLSEPEGMGSSHNDEPSAEDLAALYESEDRSRDGDEVRPSDYREPLTEPSREEEHFPSDSEYREEDRGPHPSELPEPGAGFEESSIPFEGNYEEPSREPTPTADQSGHSEEPEAREASVESPADYGRRLGENARARAAAAAGTMFAEPRTQGPEDESPAVPVTPAAPPVHLPATPPPVKVQDLEVEPARFW